MIKGILFPRNTMVFLAYIIEIATLDLFETDSIDEKLYDLPEQEPFSMNFEAFGIETILFVTNIGSIIWITYFNIFLAIVGLSCSKVNFLWNRLGSKIYFNGIIRFI